MEGFMYAEIFVFSLSSTSVSLSREIAILGS